MSPEQPNSTPCDECGSPFYRDASPMSGLCPECAHHLYGYPPCQHQFDAYRCTRCGWDGARSAFIEKLIAQTRPTDT